MLINGRSGVGKRADISGALSVYKLGIKQSNIVPRDRLTEFVLTFLLSFHCLLREIAPEKSPKWSEGGISSMIPSNVCMPIRMRGIEQLIHPSFHFHIPIPRSPFHF